MTPEARQRVLDTLAEPTVKKMLVMSWWERQEITTEEAHALILSNGLRDA